MTRRLVSRLELPALPLWKKIDGRRGALSFDFEVTARCNLNCRHCYINVPAGDRVARKQEVDPSEAGRIGAEAASLGVLWCLITGGEPLVRKDFFEIYLALKRQGLLLSVYTNATLISKEHIWFFKKYPPRDIEVTVYGVTEETYERVTRVRGSFSAFKRGLELLTGNGLNVRLKAMAMRSNHHELSAIAAFSRAHTKDYFRFDPFLHYRFDRDPCRNADIEAERLTPDEIVALEREDRQRFQALEKNCDRLIVPEFSKSDCRHIFRCDAGLRNFVIGADGRFRLCASLYHPDLLFDLRKGSLAEAWTEFVPMVLDKKTDRKDYLERCARCPIVNLCLWCPAHAYLESGELDVPIDSFCQLARARAKALEKC